MVVCASVFLIVNLVVEQDRMKKLEMELNAVKDLNVSPDGGVWVIDAEEMEVVTVMESDIKTKLNTEGSETVTSTEAETSTEVETITEGNEIVTNTESVLETEANTESITEPSITSEAKVEAKISPTPINKGFEHRFEGIRAASVIITPVHCGTRQRFDPVSGQCKRVL